MRFLSLFIVAAFLFTCGLVYKVALVDFETPYQGDGKKTVAIPHGASLKTVSEHLAAEGIIKDPDVFYWSLRIRSLLGLNRGFVHAGEYAFPALRSYHTIVDTLFSGDVILYRFTIPEGLTSQEIMTRLKNQKELSGDVPDIIPEGSLLAETYTFSKGAARLSIVKQAQDALRVVLSDMWARRLPDHPLQSPEEALILASIVEKETAIPQERPLIAGVFLNRLAKGMLLQTDPTVIYAHELKQGRPFQGQFLKKHLDIQSPYNTYKYPGLTPGPICHVGIEALKAVMSPQKTEALYFVADGTGGHVFSKTYAEHQQNHIKWRHIKRRLKQEGRR